MCLDPCVWFKFSGGQGWWHFQNPLPPMNNFCLYPPPVLRCFWKDPLMTPHPHHPTSSTFHCYPPPHPPPLPPKNFNHTPCHKWLENIKIREAEYHHTLKGRKTLLSAVRRKSVSLATPNKIVWSTVTSYWTNNIRQFDPSLRETRE